jgi:Flp pilus assembly protein TadB
VGRCCRIDRLPTLGSGVNKETKRMTIGAALVVIVVGVLIAAFLNSTIGVIVAVVGVVGLILAVVSNGRSSARL